MKCRHATNRVYLYQANEMNWIKKIRFRIHLNHCNDCQTVLKNAQDMFSQLNQLETSQPNPDLIDNILRFSRNHEKRSGFWTKLFQTCQHVLRPKYLAWEVSLSLAVVLILVFMQPLERQKRQSSLALAWNDNFYAEADYLVQAMNEVEGNQPVTSSDFVESTNQDLLSPLTRDLQEIRETVENIEVLMNDI